MKTLSHPPLQDRIAVVTGGSSGIGAATVQALAREGATVVIGYHQGHERAEALRQQLPGGPQAHHTLQLPLEDGARHDAAAQWLGQQFGRLDLLVNCAGFTQRIAHAQIEALEPELFNRILCANVGGTYALTRALLPLLQASRDAAVVNVSSVSAFTGLGSNMAYCAAKAALDTLTVSMARAFGPVRFVCVSPAAVDTDFVGGRSREELQHKAARTPLGRVVAPDDVADVILACATHLRTATGARIVIDGGHSLG